VRSVNMCKTTVHKSSESVLKKKQSKVSCDYFGCSYTTVMTEKLFEMQGQMPQDQKVSDREVQGHGCT